MPIVARDSTEQVILNKDQIETLEKHIRHGSTFHESILYFHIKNGFITLKQLNYIDSCNQCYPRRRGYYEYGFI